MKRGILLLCFCAPLVALGCGSSGGAHSDAAASSNGDSIVPGAAGVQTVIVQAIQIPGYVDLPAHIEPDPTRVVHVFAPAGGKIVELTLRPWDRVEKGQTLATIESSDLSRAVADYHKALADYDVKQRQLTRSEDLLAHNAIATKEYEQAKADAQSAQAEVDAAKEQIQVFGMDPDRASTQLLVTAPRSGVALDVGASPGEFSTALAAPQPLCTIADLSAIWAVGDIYEADLAAAKQGETAQVAVSAYPGQEWKGHVNVVSDAVDPNTRTLHVRVVLANADGRLKPQMFGTIRLLRSSRRGILLPVAAVIREGTAAYIFVSAGNGNYRRQNVTLGDSVDGDVEITSGVKPGDTVAVEGALLLRAGSAS